MSSSALVEVAKSTIDVEKIDYNCEKTWKLFAEGRTKGIFQLESNLGKSWAKKVAPKNIEELSALIAIIRPGTLKAYVDGKSMTQRYVDRKWGREDITYLHPALEDILRPTFGVLVYQEQSMRIAQKIAGFNEQDADSLRKAIGKKDADLMNKVKKAFIEGANRVNIVSQEEAEQIFGWIQKSARYAFNKSHSVLYAFDSYWSAYFKAHYTKAFILAYLTFAHEKQEQYKEIYDLISEAKMFDIEVKTPNLSNMEKRFHFKNGKIYFGVKDVKSLSGKTGDNVVDKIREIEASMGKPATKFSWLEVLLFLSPHIKSNGFKALASIGFFRDCADNITRNKALYDYEIFRTLTDAEYKWVVANYPNKKWKTLIDCLKDLAPTKKEGGGTSKVDRKLAIENEIQLLINPPYELEDEPSWVVDQETKLLGCPVSMSRVETSDTSAANTTCKEILNGKSGNGMCVVANIQRISDYKITKGKSKGQLMAFLTIEDETCSLDSVIAFPSVREKYKYVLYEGNNLIFCGHVDKSDSTFIIDTIHEV